MEKTLVYSEIEHVVNWQGLQKLFEVAVHEFAGRNSQEQLPKEMCNLEKLIQKFFFQNIYI